MVPSSHDMRKVSFKLDLDKVKKTAAEYFPSHTSLSKRPDVGSVIFLKSVLR